MNKRLIWNFEIDTKSVLDWESLRDEKEEIRWERRFFFEESDIITLTGLSDAFLDLSQLTIEHKEDHYILIPGQDFNIKYRANELLFKPRFKTRSSVQGYGKKINLTSWPRQTALPGDHLITATNLLTLIEDTSHKIVVIKEAVTCKLPTKPKIRLELARLTIENKTWFSACVEGRSHELVDKISKHLMPEGISCDYVSFLNKILK